MIEIIPNKNRLPSPERRRSGSDFVGVRTRLVLKNQEYLKPSTAVPSQFEIASFQERNYKPFEHASTVNRNDHWKNEPTAQTFEQQYSLWENSVVDSFNHEQNGDKMAVLGTVLYTMGIQKDPEKGFSKDHAQKLYDRYFEGEEGVKKFVDDVMTSYKHQEDQGYSTISNHIDTITWMARIFGDEGQQMVRELILAEITLKSKPELLKQALELRKNQAGEDVMRINDLDDEEKRFLDFVTKTKPLENRQDVAAPTAPPPDEEEGTQEEEPKKIENLPIDRHKTEIQNAIKNNDSVIVIGKTGSGKTVKTPQFIREIMQPGERLIVTEPRQINTSELAATVAREQGVTLGKEIGFQHGDEKRFTEGVADTVFMTEGTLLRRIAREIERGNLMEEWTHFMMDEVHVRSKDSELLLQTLKALQQKRKEAGKKPLKIIAASATVDKQKLQDYLSGSQTIEVEGRTKPIEFHYSDEFAGGPIDERQIPNTVAQVVKIITESGKQGDILIFDAAVSDLDQIEKALKARNFENVQISKLHSGSTEEEKAEAAKPPTPGVRRIIIGTNFVETGITIKGLKFVINTGREFERTVDPISGLEYLKKGPQAQAGVDQRSGRVGRITPGEVYNLFTKADYESRPLYPTPELERTDLTDFVLSLKKNNIRDILGVDLLSKLPPERVAFAEETLSRLGALNTDGSLNEIGRQMYELPVDYHLGRMIVAARQEGKGIQEVCSIAAVSEAARNMVKGNRRERARTLARFKNPTSDFLTLLNVWNEFEANGKTREWAENNGFSYEALSKADSARDKLLRRMRGGSAPATEEKLGRFIYEGYKDRLMQFDSSKNCYIWTRNRACSYNLKIGKDSALYGRNPSYIIAASNSPFEEGTASPEVFLSSIQTVNSDWVTP